MITKIDYTSKKDDNQFYESREKKSPEKKFMIRRAKLSINIIGHKSMGRIISAI